jgi:hypothetical protein
MEKNKARVVAIMGVLHAAYPNFIFQPDTIKVYCMMLSDLDPDLLEQAAKAHLTTNKWFPAISELRSAVTDLVERACKTPKAAEAWGIVVDKIRQVGNTVDFGGNHPDCLSDYPLVDKVVRYMGWNNLCLSENTVADRARFIQAYEVELSRAREDMQFLPETHDAIAQLQAEKVNENVKRLTGRLSVTP